MPAMRRIVVLLLLAVTLSAAAPKKKAAPPAKKSAPAPAAPAELPHPIAQFLRTLTDDGKRAVTFKATAVGTRFFFEETNGVTVYRWTGSKYVKEQYVAGGKLPGVVKRYAKM